MTLSSCRLNLETGSFSFRYTPEAARQLQACLQDLVERLKISASAPPGDRPAPQANVEYQHTGDVFLEVFCNPNIWPSPFAAKVLITLRDDRIRLSVETSLDRLISDVNDYLEQES
ncbi:MAG TPA: hypothetical protein V6D46_02185 [Coleofasciculaceae cyanobacterium]